MQTREQILPSQLPSIGGLVWLPNSPPRALFPFLVRSQTVFLVAPLSSTKSSFITHYFPCLAFLLAVLYFLLTCIVFSLSPVLVLPPAWCLFSHQHVVSHLYLFSPMSPSCTPPHSFPTPSLSPQHQSPSTQQPNDHIGKVVLCFMTTAPDDRRKSWNFKLRKENSMCNPVVLLLKVLRL